MHHWWQSRQPNQTLPEYLVINFATKTAVTRILVWLIWCLALLVFIQPTAWQVGGVAQAAAFAGKFGYTESLQSVS
jgi:hypothetical protein